MAQLDMRHAMVDAYTLYKVFWRAMGLQLSRLLTSPPLWIKIVVDRFQEGGTFALTRQLLRMEVTTEPSSFFQASSRRHMRGGQDLVLSWDLSASVC